MTINDSRCPRCGIPLLTDVKVLWCRVVGCREADMSTPSDMLCRVLKIGATRYTEVRLFRRKRDEEQEEQEVARS